MGEDYDTPPCWSLGIGQTFRKQKEFKQNSAEIGTDPAYCQERSLKIGENSMKSQGVSTKAIREVYGMTQVQFAEKFEIPLRTVQNWEQRSCCPVYVLRMLQWCLYYESECARLEKLTQV